MRVCLIYILYGMLGFHIFHIMILNLVLHESKSIWSADTVCPGSSDPPKKIFDIFASENEVYTIY